MALSADIVRDLDHNPQEQHMTETASAVETTAETTAAPETEATLVEQDLLVEDVSIDGMCGVY
jgi:mycofactocin precursor